MKTSTESKLFTLARQGTFDPQAYMAEMAEVADAYDRSLLSLRLMFFDNAAFNTALEAWKASPEGMAFEEAERQRMIEQEKAEKAQKEKDRVEARIRKRKNAVRRMIEQLEEEIPQELWLTRIKPSHPDFDLAAFKSFLRTWKPGEERNAILWGSPGTGKSRVLARAAERCAKRLPFWDLAWTTGGRFAELVSCLGQSDERKAAKVELNRLAEAGILFFDDLGSAHFTGPRISAFFNLMDERCGNNRARGQPEARQRAHSANPRLRKPTTRQEKRDAVDLALLKNAELPDREHARQLGVSHTFIAMRRRKGGNVSSASRGLNV
ncbi:MAG: hypothetical protein M0Q93_07970 [Terrimicrobiaceae bacterium]|nr:hypothetical protein [Terrimicrobiaceae bacterium]